MERHFKSSRKPLFMFIQTMSAHWPYDYKFEPGSRRAGRRPGHRPRRCTNICAASRWPRSTSTALMRELRRRFPRSASWSCTTATITRWPRARCSAQRTREAEDVALKPGFTRLPSPITRSPASTTPAKPLPPVEALDVPYLGAVILDAARLPLSEAIASASASSRPATALITTAPSRIRS